MCERHALMNYYCCVLEEKFPRRYRKKKTSSCKHETASSQFPKYFSLCNNRMMDIDGLQMNKILSNECLNVVNNLRTVCNGTISIL